MNEWPNWAVALVGVASATLSGVGVMTAGWFRAKSDNQRVRVDDRADFLQQVMARLAQVEKATVEERKFCEERLAAQDEVARQRLESRDAIISELRQRISQLEQNLDASTGAQK